MPKPMYVWTGTAWVSVASEVESLATYATQSYADNTPGLRQVTPASVSVGSGSSSVTNGGTVTFSGASSVSLNTCFNSTYSLYRIMFNLTTATADGSLNLRLRNGSTDAATNYNQGGLYNSNTTVAGEVFSSATSYYVMSLDAGNNGQYYSSIIELFNPFSAERTQINHTSQGYSQTGTKFTGLYGANHDTASSYDGFSLIATAGTISGTVRVYGYKNG